jgi:hypothetical protein
VLLKSVRDLKRGLIVLVVLWLILTLRLCIVPLAASLALLSLKGRVLQKLTHCMGLGGLNRGLRASCSCETRAVATRCGNLTNPKLNVIRGILVLLREEVAQHADR